jgi:outer membrane protein assembly factor BamB
VIHGREKMKATRLGLLAVTVAVAYTAVKADTNWPSYRGKDAAGVAEGYPTPVKWDVETRQGLRWKTPIPGLGHGSPVIWGDRIYVTSAVSTDKNSGVKTGLYGSGDSAEDNSVQKWILYCVDRKSGRMIWERKFREGVPKIKRHTKATHANTTVATDGRNIVVFLGSDGLFCLDMTGKRRWMVDVGVIRSSPYDAPTLEWGFASSPIIAGDRVIVQCDGLGNAFVAAFDLNSGDEVWKTKREEVATWSTPAVCREGGRSQVVVNGWKHMGGYDLQTGKELWKMSGGGDIPVPTPVVAHGLIYISNGHGRMNPIYAVKPTATGDITLKEAETSNDHIVWSTPRDGTYLQTPLVYGDYLYAVKSNGVLRCFEAKTGKKMYEERLGTGRSAFTSSPVGADGKVYAISEEGDVYVVEAGPAFKLLATNPLGEVCLTTPAISQGILYIRTQDHLVAIERQPPSSTR